MAGQATPVRSECCRVSPGCRDPQQIDGQVERLPGCREGHVLALGSFKAQRLNLSMWDETGNIPALKSPTSLQRGLLCHLASQEQGRDSQRSQGKVENRPPPTQEGNPFQGSRRKTPLPQSSVGHQRRKRHVRRQHSGRSLAQCGIL